MCIIIILTQFTTKYDHSLPNNNDTSTTTTTTTDTTPSDITSVIMPVTSDSMSDV